MSGASIAVVAFCLVAAALIAWARKAMAVRVPRRFTRYQMMLGAGCVLAIVALVRGTGGGASTLAAAFALAAGCMYLFFSVTGRMDRKEPAVRVGGLVLDFSAVDGDGATLRLSSFSGRPFLLKCFRGAW